MTDNRDGVDVCVVPKQYLQDLKRQAEKNQMTLRDQFAMAALPALITKLEWQEDIIIKSYEFADGMMEARDGNYKKAIGAE